MLEVYGAQQGQNQRFCTSAWNPRLQQKQHPSSQTLHVSISASKFGSPDVGALMIQVPGSRRLVFGISRVRQAPC